MNNQKKTEILEKFSNLLDNAYQVNDVVYCLDVDNLYKLPKDITYNELNRNSLVVNINKTKFTATHEAGQPWDTNASYGFVGVRRDKDPLQFAYNVRRDGKFIYNEAEEFEKIKLVIQKEVNKLQQWVKYTIDNLVFTEKEISQINDIFKDVKNILQKNNNTQLTFDTVYHKKIVLTSLFEFFCIRDNFLNDVLDPTLNSLKCQMIIEFNK